MIPKFRTWDKESQQICNVGALYFSRDYELEAVSIHLHSGFVTNRNLGDCILMQSTGLKDKNGVEIYEGDVLLHTSSSINYCDTYWHSYVQVYRMNSGAYRIKGKHIYDTELMSARNRIEVVGNIYQNQYFLDKEYFSTSDGIVEQVDK